MTNEILVIDDNADIRQLISGILKDKGFSKPVYCFHSTTFLPFFPLGIRSFKWKFIFRKDTYSYIRT